MILSDYVPGLANGLQAAVDTSPARPRVDESNQSLQQPTHPVPPTRLLSANVANYRNPSSRVRDNNLLRLQCLYARDGSDRLSQTCIGVHTAHDTGVGNSSGSFSTYRGYEWQIRWGGARQCRCIEGEPNMQYGSGDDETVRSNRDVGIRYMLGQIHAEQRGLQDSHLEYHEL